MMTDGFNLINMLTLHGKNEVHKIKTKLKIKNENMGNNYITRFTAFIFLI